MCSADEGKALGTLEPLNMSDAQTTDNTTYTLYTESSEVDEHHLKTCVSNNKLNESMYSRLHDTTTYPEDRSSNIMTHKDTG
jgi:hypothetical protein